MQNTQIMSMIIHNVLKKTTTLTSLRSLSSGILNKNNGFETANSKYISILYIVDHTYYFVTQIGYYGQLSLLIARKKKTMHFPL